MTAIEICLLVALVPVVLTAAGYWLADGLRALSAAERLAVAMLAALFALIWAVSVVNLALPIAGLWSWICVVPWLVPLGRAKVRRNFSADLTAVLGNRRGAGLALAAIAFLGALLWPLLSRPEVIFYDGTAGHDAFFWIVGAEHLQQHTYLQPAVTSPVHPLYYSIESIVGLRPVWGRMGAEGFLALVSSLVGASPLQIYVAGTAALFFPWVAASFLVLRAFFRGRVGFASALALVLLQPAFVFFHANANLPNLLGALAAAGTVVAWQRALAAERASWSWLVLLVLSGHALMGCYPELIPGTALSMALLLARAAWQHGAARIGRPFGVALLALAINPVTTLRASSGVIASVRMTTHVEAPGNIFDSVEIAARAPAMVTLSPSFGHLLGATGGVVCSVLLAIAVIVALRRAHDRFGAMAMLAGGIAILGYTLTRDFAYGWQKTVQFSGVFLATLLPCGVIGDFDLARASARWLGSLAAAVTLFFVSAVVMHLYEVHKWAGRKYLTADWFAAREFSRHELRNEPVEVATATFDYPFFYTMWAAYFLDESRISFSPATGGGYLRSSIEKYPPDWRESPRARFVSGSALAEAFWRRGSIGFVAVEPPLGREPKR